MTRGAPAGYTTPTTSANPAPVWFLRVATGLSAPDNIVLVTNYNRAVTFPSSGSDSYTPRPIQVPETVIGEDMAGGGGLLLTLGDADGFWRGYKDDGADFAGKRVSLYRADTSALSSSSNMIWNDFYVDAPEWNVGGKEHPPPHAVLLQAASAGPAGRGDAGGVSGGAVSGSMILAQLHRRHRRTEVLEPDLGRGRRVGRGLPGHRLPDVPPGRRLPDVR